MPPRHALRVGKWLPEDENLLQAWLARLIERIETKNNLSQPPEMHPVIQEFQELIEGDAVIYMLFSQMFHQIPDELTHDPAGKPQVRDYRLMLLCFNEIITTAPPYDNTGMVGFPINAILDWPMGTPAGLAAFLNEKVNVQVGKMLNVWGAFLKSPQSAYVLNTDSKTGWFGVEAMTQMPEFDTTFECDPTKKHRGFTSWDDFFTRRFRPGVRPVAYPDDDRYIVNACESAPYDIQKNVKLRDCFWIKTQPYSITHMLAGDHYAERFIGGTVYQAYLSALSYHRWHSPVSGTVVKKYVVPGAYYSEAKMAGFDSNASTGSMGYITEVATRALIFIQADNLDIGLMVFLAVGMAEVSTCDIQVDEGQRLRKGEELGMFHYGGSTYCLIFRKGVNVIFQLSQEPGLDATNIDVNAAIGFVQSPSGEARRVYDKAVISGSDHRDFEDYVFV